MCTGILVRCSPAVSVCVVQRSVSTSAIHVRAQKIGRLSTRPPMGGSGLKKGRGGWFSLCYLGAGLGGLFLE